MNSYNRIFGAGPRGLLMSLALLAAALKLEKLVGLPVINNNQTIRWSLFFIFILATVLMLIWSLLSLPPAARGHKLVTNGAYKYFRHPLYAAFLLFFDFGLATILNNWIYVIWAIILHGVWHLNIISEEKLMQLQFPGIYDKYCAVTGRFLPRFRQR